MVQILDLGHVGDDYYIVMELIKGPSVGAVLGHADGGLPWEVAGEIVAQVCDGLHAAHELRDADGTRLGLVHRDVSPSNIMVTDNGGVKLVDFGIAKARDSVIETDAGRVKGKTCYLSPEACRGAAVDRRADLFALGATFFELLRGQRLFKRESHVDTFRAICDEPIPDPRSVRPDLPAPVARVLLHALERDPSRRFATAEEMGGALRAASAGLLSPLVLGEFLRKRCANLFERRAAQVRVAETRAADDTPTVLETNPLQVGPPVGRAGGGFSWSSPWSPRRSRGARFCDAAPGRRDP